LVKKGYLRNKSYIFEKKTRFLQANKQNSILKRIIVLQIITMADSPLSFLCIASFFKGENFMVGAKKAGCTVYLLTSKKLESEPWPWDSIDEVFYMTEDASGEWNYDDMVAGTAYVMRSRTIDRIVSLDDFDVEKGAHLRETFRIPGMGQTTGRYFRDKLAMRVRAQEAGIPVPPFTPIFNDEEINQYLKTTTGPWLIKPRSEASATGIQKVQTAEEAWNFIHSLGDKRHRFLIEQFRPGDVYHVDALSFNGKIVFIQVSRYLATPMEVAHGGGIFRSMTIPYNSDDDKKLKALNETVMDAFGMQYSASHTEFIKNKETGEFYFLETASRVGGAHLADMVEAASGVNLWYEWAILEAAAARNKSYKAPKPKKNHAGILVSLARTEWPNMDVFNEKEVDWKIKKPFHVGVIVSSTDENRVLSLLDKYADIVQKEFHASAPISSKPTS
jgi:hypothetical protein